MTQGTLPEWNYGDFSNGKTHYIEHRPSGDPTQARQTVVLLQGIGTSGDGTFRFLAAELQALGYRVIVYDLYGRGRSSGPLNRDYGPETYIAQLSDLLDHLGLTDKPVCLVGFSIGSSIATMFAKRHPKRVRSLSLLAPTGYRTNVPRQPPRPVSNLLIERLPGLLRLFQRPIVKRTTSSEFGDSRNEKIEFVLDNLTWQSKHNSEFYRALFETTMSFPFGKLETTLRELAELRDEIPMQVMLADRDRRTPYKPNQEFFREILPNEFISVLEGSGHWFVHERLHEVVVDLDRFLRACDF